tara:strand:+ start:3699 stop:5174 length:1476 start_codon:yes stop_codon:yes gene_type:complete
VTAKKLSSPLARVTGIFFIVTIVCLTFADLTVTTVDPWSEFGRLASGLISPDFFSTDSLVLSLAYTLAFALLGVLLGNLIGFGFALLFSFRLIRIFCAVIRAVHELFWALIFLQLFGLSPITGILAIAIPYSGIIAKVYAEILEESDQSPLEVLSVNTSRASTFLFVRLPDAWVQFKTYSMYRLECGLRSSAVLGFIGLPTLGFHLESAFKEGHYQEVSALLIVFYILIATMRFWMKRQFLPVYLILSVVILPWDTNFSASNILRFLTEDIIPYPMRDNTASMMDWVHLLVVTQAFPGMLGTLQLTMIALFATGILTMLFFPLISPLFFKMKGRGIGHVFLVIIRSTPEYILAFILLQLWGPSMLPAIVALAFHNSAIIGHLIGRYTENIALRQDSVTGINRYFYEVSPRIYRPMLALLFYRWEVILRETAILGMLGVATIGFYIDSAFSDLRFDRALVLIAITAMMNICVDAISRLIRSHLRLKTSLEYK